MLKIKFEKLDYQEKAISSICSVLRNIYFKPNENPSIGILLCRKRDELYIKFGVK